MQRYLAEGLAAAEAAALAAEPAAEAADATFAPAVLRRDLEGALSAFDEPRAHSILDSLLAATTLDSALSEVIVPYLHELGERWERGDASVAQEHFASSVLRGRLLGLARGWGRGLGQTVLLACAPSEQHDLGLIAFGLALRARGWRIGYLGADTPLDSVSSAARAFEPLFVVISAVSADRFQAIEGELGALAREQRVCLGGAAASERLNLDAVMLTGDPVHEAERLTTLATSSADA
jgi:methanogenic corrinoid protein MtbC1